MVVGAFKALLLHQNSLPFVVDLSLFYEMTCLEVASVGKCFYQSCLSLPFPLPPKMIEENVLYFFEYLRFALVLGDIRIQNCIQNYYNCVFRIESPIWF